MRFQAADGIKNPDYSERLEWLETNGLGGFASSSVIGLNTRRYHGLLTAAIKPPVGRVLLISKLEEVLVADGVRYELGSNRFPGGVFPAGHSLLEEFSLDPFPRWVYRAGKIQLTKSVFMPQGQNAVVVEYTITTTDGADFSGFTLELRPLLAFRDFHSLTHENQVFDSALTIRGNLISIQPYADLPRMYLSHNGGVVQTTNCWYREFEYVEEKERGLDFVEDLHNPFVLSFSDIGTIQIIAADTAIDANCAGEMRERELRRREALTIDGASPAPLVSALCRAADQFLVQRGDGQTIIAGYPWFSDWGRDTMISLPGLTLATGRFEAARGILRSFSRYVSQGMLPNRFPDQGEEPEYNTVDATLWYFEAIRAYVERSGDFDLVAKELYPVLSDIIDWHLKGTRFGIGADSDGLLKSGVPGVQLTWMDAKVGELVITPRTGKAVEIQALWYSALVVFAEFAGRVGDFGRQQKIRELVENVRLEFEASFWNSDEECLFDVIDGEYRDGAVRPNQLLAVSLHHSLLEGERARKVVEVVRDRLLTPRGLRTLDPHDYKYQGRYGGDISHRDGAYHQGTVWPWLLGPFISAYIKVNGRTDESLSFVKDLIEQFSIHLREAGLGSISEVFDGDAPHRPGGCIAQAWSVAEILRVLVELPELGS